MADGFIVRKGGVAVERTTAPSINFVSKTHTEIVVTFTNNDAAEVEVYYGLTSTLTDTVTLAAAATSSNITFSGLDEDTTFTVSAYALVTDPISKKIKSEIVTSTIATNEIPAPTITLVSKTDTSVTFTLKNNSVETRDVTVGLTTPPTTTTISLASDATSGNQTFSNLDSDTFITIFAQAEGGLIGQLNVTTDPSLVFTAATGGITQEYNSGGKRFKSHTFISSGNFVVSTVGDNIDDRNKVDYLIIAGGGSGGTVGGGGAGGYRTTNGTSGANSSAESKVVVTATTFGITIGAGSTSTRGSGSNTLALSRTSLGGGGGGANVPSGVTGGSGGGSRDGASAGSGTSLQGFGGGVGGFNWGGGGGGAGQSGANGANGVSGGKGGNGLSNTLRTGSAQTRGGGGGGFFGGAANVPGAGGSGGGGTGGTNIASQTRGSANTGGGGGGGFGADANRNGGSGLVVIRYEIAPS